MTRPRALQLLAAVLALCAVATEADAQPSAPARDPKVRAADALWRAAFAARDKGDWATACAKFEASMRLDPAVSTLVNVAKCHEHEGRLATARAELEKALELNGGSPELEKYTKKLLADLEPRVPKLTIAVREKPAGLRVTRDGVEVPAAKLGAALPVDPGTYVVTAEAPHKTAWSAPVVVAEGRSVPVDVPPLADEPPPAPPPVLLPTPPPPPVAQQDRARKIAGGVLLGVGAAGAVAGGVLAALAHGKYTDLLAHCSTQTNCNPDLGPELGTYHAESAASVASFVVAGASLVAGLVVLLTAPKAPPAASAFVAPQLGLGYAGVRGAF